MFVSQSKYEKLEKEYRVSRDECRDLKIKSSTLEVENQKLNEQNELLTSQLDQMTKDYDSLKTQVSLICTRYKTMKLAIDVLNESVSDKSADLKVESLLKQL